MLSFSSYSNLSLFCGVVIQKGFYTPPTKHPRTLLQLWLPCNCVSVYLINCVIVNKAVGKEAGWLIYSFAHSAADRIKHPPTICVACIPCGSVAASFCLWFYTRSAVLFSVYQWKEFHSLRRCRCRIPCPTNGAHLRRTDGRWWRRGVRTPTPSHCHHWWLAWYECCNLQCNVE